MNGRTSIEQIIAETDILLKNGENEKAEQTLIKAVEQYMQAEPDDKIGQAVLLNELGGFYRNNGIFDKGEVAYLKAKEYIEDSMKNHEDVSESDSIITNYATTLNNLAGLYRMDQCFQKAIETFDMAICLYEKYKDKVPSDYRASVYNNKGNIFLDIRDFEQARAMYMRAKVILEQGGDYKFAMATTISNLGIAFAFEEKYAEAAKYFCDAKMGFETVGNTEMAKSCEVFQLQMEAKK